MGDTHPAPGLGAVAGEFPVQVEAADPLAALDGALVDPAGRDDPGDLELQPVRILGVEALRRAVVAGADEGAGLGEAGGEALQFGQRVDLPGQVVQADGAAAAGR